MERIVKASNDYKTYLERHNHHNIGAFFASDYQEIKENSKSLYDVMDLALTAGFMIGYRRAKREERHKKGLCNG